MKFLPILLTAVLPFAACTKHDAPSGTPQHSNEPMDHGHGEKKPLGPLTIGTNTFQVVQEGDVKAGAEGAFDLEFAKGKTLPATVRGWIGAESGEGSMKAKFTKEDETTLHGHVAVPAKIPADAKLWIEIEEGGKPAHASI